MLHPKLSIPNKIEPADLPTSESPNSADDNRATQSLLAPCTGWLRPPSGPTPKLTRLTPACPGKVFDSSALPARPSPESPRTIGLPPSSKWCLLSSEWLLSFHAYPWIVPRWDHSFKFQLASVQPRLAIGIENISINHPGLAVTLDGNVKLDRPKDLHNRISSKLRL